MAIIYSYPEIPDVQGGDLLLISDTGAPNKPTRSVDIDDLAAYIGTVVGVGSVESIDTSNTSFINMTPTVPATGNVELTASLSASGTPDNTKFLRGDNVWAEIVGVQGSGTANYTARWTDSSTLGIGALYDNGANVGIGTTIPTKNLEIGTNGSAETEFRMHSDQAGKYINIQSAGNFTGVKTTGSQNFILDSSGSSGYITMVTNATERIRVNYNGRVGIGTTSPGTKLEVSNSGSNGAVNENLLINMPSASNYVPGTGSTIGFKGLSQYFGTLGGYTNGIPGLGFWSGTNTGAPSMVLISGNVGIGTTSPSEKLEVSGARSNLNGILIGEINSYIQFPDEGQLAVGNNDWLIVNEGGVEVMRAGGPFQRLGIGTTSPSEKLDVRGNIHIEEVVPSIIFKRNISGLQEYRIKNEGNFTIEKTTLVNGGSFIIKDENGKTPLSVSMGLLNPDIIVSGDLIVKNKTGTTTNLYVQEDNGNVGIGTTSPLSKLNVNGDIKIEGENELYFGSSGSVPLWEIKASGSDLVINDTGSNVGSVLFNNDEGIVLPRLTTTEINAISLPNTGLTVYNTTLNTLCFYNGSSWQKVNHANM